MFSVYTKQLPVLLCLFVFAIACSREKTIDEQPKVANKAPTPYYLARPMGFPPPFLSKDNPMTVEGVELGKRLYSDPILSSNGMSCSSCHAKERSYSAPMFHAQNGANISVPPHVNLAFKSYYNWEGSVENLDTACMGDFEPEFFNTQQSDLYKRLSTHTVYADLINKAFGVSNINTLSYHQLKTYLCYAISQYMRTLVSANSTYDSSRMFGFHLLTPDEFDGMTIFFSERGDCFHCHSAPLLTDNTFHNNGLDDQYVGFNKGRNLVTGEDKDLGKFLTPTLRNIALTAPYMHDGRFATLEEVIEFYNSGVKPSPYVDPILNKRENIRALNLTEREKRCLLLFLQTFTDESFGK